jgi:hypothetical protein
VRGKERGLERGISWWLVLHGGQSRGEVGSARGRSRERQRTTGGARQATAEAPGWDWVTGLSRLGVVVNPGWVPWWAAREKNGEGKRWSGCKRIGPTGRVLKIASPILKLIFYFPNCFEFKPCLKFD